MDEAIEPIVSMLSPAKDKGNRPQEGANRDDWGGWIFAFARKEVTAKAAEHVETGYMNIGEVGKGVPMHSQEKGRSTSSSSSKTPIIIGP